MKAVRNKFAQTVALLFKMEYPREWPNFFSEMFYILQLGPALIQVSTFLFHLQVEDVLKDNEKYR
jgi:hypothetical protein